MCLSPCSCRKEIALRKEKSREPGLEDSLLVLMEPEAPSHPEEAKPLIAQDKVAKGEGQSAAGLAAGHLGWAPAGQNLVRC